jgi:predicted PhzF superfamily epimerase YddE/YHI9
MSDVAVNVEQGVEVNRPSLLSLQARDANGQVMVRVGGHVVVAGQGSFYI